MMKWYHLTPSVSLDSNLITLFFFLTLSLVSFLSFFFKKKMEKETEKNKV